MKKLGFTLAEVLITLVIIGVIAAMTVPTLMQNTQGQEYRSAFKKAISAANQALTLNYALDGLSANDYANGAALAEMFKKRMNIMVETTAPTELPKGADGTSPCTGQVWRTADGIMYCINSNFSSTSTTENQKGICNSYNTTPCSSGAPNLYIDVNGERKPNKLTTDAARPRDVYQAMIYAQKVIPYGAAAQQVMYDKTVEVTGG